LRIKVAKYTNVADVLCKTYVSAINYDSVYGWQYDYNAANHVVIPYYNTYGQLFTNILNNKLLYILSEYKFIVALIVHNM
jgi:hypothetical protein